MNLAYRRYWLPLDRPVESLHLLPDDLCPHARRRKISTLFAIFSLLITINHNLTPLEHSGDKPPPSINSPLNNEKRKGTFVCAGCKSALYDSSTKFDSGTGWCGRGERFDRPND